MKAAQAFSCIFLNSHFEPDAIRNESRICFSSRRPAYGAASLSRGLFDTEIYYPECLLRIWIRIAHIRIQLRELFR